MMKMQRRKRMRRKRMRRKRMRRKGRWWLLPLPRPQYKKQQTFPAQGKVNGRLSSTCALFLQIFDKFFN